MNGLLVYAVLVKRLNTLQFWGGAASVRSRGFGLLTIPKDRVQHSSGILIGFGVLVVYSLFGGIRAVAFTDTFQGLVLLVAIPVACSVALHELGGYTRLLAELPITHLSIDFTEGNILLLASMLFYTVIPISAGTFMQRFLMANDSKQLSKAFKLIAYTSLPFAFVICLIGFIMKVNAPDVDSNIAFFT